MKSLTSIARAPGPGPKPGPRPQGRGAKPGPGAPAPGPWALALGPGGRAHPLPRRWCTSSASHGPSVSSFSGPFLVTFVCLRASLCLLALAFSCLLDCVFASLLHGFLVCLNVCLFDFLIACLFVGLLLLVCFFFFVFLACSQCRVRPEFATPSNNARKRTSDTSCRSSTVLFRGPD